MAEDMQLMQQEAARRVRRMQEHSRRVFEEYGGRTPESLRAAQPPHYAPPSPHRRPAEEEKSGQDSRRDTPCLRQAAEEGGLPPARGDLAKGSLWGEMDTEQLLLLGLALLLFRNGCRVELIVALLYLAM